MSTAQDTKKNQQAPAEAREEEEKDDQSTGEQQEEQSEESSEEEPEPEPVKQKKKSKKQQQQKKKKKQPRVESDDDDDDEDDEPVGSLVKGGTEQVGKATDTVGNAAGAVTGGGKEDGGDKPLALRLDLNIEAEVTLKVSTLRRSPYDDIHMLTFVASFGIQQAKIHGDITLSLL